MSSDVERPFMAHVVTSRGLWRVYVRIRGTTFDFGTLPAGSLHTEVGDTPDCSDSEGDR